MTTLTLGALRPFRHLDHPREVIRQFTPNWFAVTMGTGVLGLALVQLPESSALFEYLGAGLWYVACALFALFSLLYAARWWLYFDEARRIFGHSTVSMFFGTIPMGLATVLNGALHFGVARYGEGLVPLVHALWWLDVALSVICGVAIPFLMFTRQEHSIDQMTAVWLLPVVAAEVAAVSGGLLAAHLPVEQRLAIVATGYVLWAFSLAVAFAILVLLVLRMALHKVPPAHMAASSWLALGPLGTGALGLLVLGGQAPAAFAAQGLGAVGEIAQGVGIVGALALWGFGAWWLLLAVLVTLRQVRRGMPFNLGWWAFTFPLGVYALATLQLGRVLHLAFFTQVGSWLVVALAILWLIVARLTLRGAWRGELFESPCIAGCKQKR